jgi:hypothetical protein
MVCSVYGPRAALPNDLWHMRRHLSAIETASKQIDENIKAVIGHVGKSCGEWDYAYSLH